MRAPCPFLGGGSGLTQGQMPRLPPLFRHGFFYALIYIGTGVSMPYAPVWFKSVGLTAPQIGVILAAPMLGRAVAGPACWPRLPTPLGGADQASLSGLSGTTFLSLP